MASAPRPTARSASASEVIPQILTSTVSPLSPRRAHRAAARPDEADRCPSAAPRRPRSERDERLAHEHRLVAGIGQHARRRLASRIPDSATATTSAGSPGPLAGAPGSTEKVARSRWLTPTSSAPASSARRALASSWTSTRASSAELPGEAQEARQLLVGRGGDDQQDGVGAHQPGIADVGTAHREVLAQHGQAASPGGPQVGGRPPKYATSVSTDTHVAPPAA